MNSLPFLPMELDSCATINLTSLMIGLFINNIVLSRMVLFSACQLAEHEELLVVKVPDAMFWGKHTALARWTLSGTVLWWTDSFDKWGVGNNVQPAHAYNQFLLVKLKHVPVKTKRSPGGLWKTAIYLPSDTLGYRYIPFKCFYVFKIVILSG